MSHSKALAMTFFIVGLVITSVTIFAKVSSIRDLKKFDNYASQEHPITIIMAYTQPKRLEKEERRALREAERGFRDASDHKVHKKINVKFAQVNLDKVPEIADEYRLNKDPKTVTLLLFKKGKSMGTVPFEITEQNAQSITYSKTKDVLDNRFGAYIDQLLDELEDLQIEIAKARASAPRYTIDPWYGASPWWDYYYHGYYYPYYRYRRPGFGFYVDID